jgi:MFS family permease
MIGRMLPGVRVLSVCKGVQIFGSSIVVTFSGLVGAELSPTTSLATLPMTVMLLAMGASTVPASFFIARLGPRGAFGLTGLVGTAGAALAALGIWTASFIAFCIGCGLMGIYQASAQYYRYAAADAVDPENKASAVSMVLAGGIGGAVLGPLISLWAQKSIAFPPFIGPFVAFALIIFISSIMLFRLQGMPASPRPSAPSAKRSISVLLGDRTYRRAVFMAAGAYAVMSYVMTATPLAIVACGYGSGTAATGIQWHLVAMFAPSFMTGFLQRRYGLRFVSSAGCAALLASLGTFAVQQDITNFIVGLVLLGTGWNLLYFAGTMLVIGAVRSEDRPTAQAMTELAAMSSAAVVSGLAGAVFTQAGWRSLLLTATIIAAALALISLTTSGSGFRKMGQAISGESRR